MPVVTQETPGSPVEQIVAVFNSGGGMLNPSSTRFQFGDYSESDFGGTTYYEFTDTIIVTGSGITYDAFGFPQGGTISSITVSPYFLSGTSNPSHGDVPGSYADFRMTGANISVAEFRSAVLAGDEDAFLELLEGQQWTYNGSYGADQFSGGDSADTLYGRAGNDALGGRDGNDTLDGGLGADYLSGGSGSDRASYINASTAVKVSLANSAVNTGEAAGDTYNSIENLTGSNYGDSLTGSNGANRMSGANGNDTINGLAGSDVIFGGSGNDRIYGHLGSDTLEGNAGSDTFIFHTALGASNIDTIVDFSRADDTIELWNDVFTALGAGPLAASAFKDMALSAKDANDRIIYNSDTGILYYDADGSGTAFGNVKFAVLSGKPDITASDFVVV